MNWTDAMAVARAGAPIRRAGWVDRWISFSQYLWWFTPVNPVTLSQGAPRVIQATDWTPFEFRAADWTTDPIPTQSTDMLLSTDIVTVPATACPWFAYSPSGLQFTDGFGDVLDSSDLARPIFVVRPSWANSLQIAASGRWGQNLGFDFTNNGPDGDPINPSALVVPDFAYHPLSGPQVNNITPVAILAGSLVGFWDNDARTATEFFIGAAATMEIPSGTNGIYLGMQASNGWMNNLGSVIADLLWSSRPLA